MLVTRVQSQIEVESVLGIFFQGQGSDESSLLDGAVEVAGQRVDSVDLLCLISVVLIGKLLPDKEEAGIMLDLVADLIVRVAEVEPLDVFVGEGVGEVVLQKQLHGVVPARCHQQPFRGLLGSQLSRGPGHGDGLEGGVVGQRFAQGGQHRPQRH